MLVSFSPFQHSVWAHAEILLNFLCRWNVKTFSRWISNKFQVNAIFNQPKLIDFCLSKVSFIIKLRISRNGLLRQTSKKKKKKTNWFRMMLILFFSQWLTITKVFFLHGFLLKQLFELFHFSFLLVLWIGDRET